MHIVYIMVNKQSWIVCICATVLRLWIFQDELDDSKYLGHLFGLGMNPVWHVYDLRVKYKRNLIPGRRHKEHGECSKNRLMTRGGWGGRGCGAWRRVWRDFGDGLERKLLYWPSLWEMCRSVDIGIETAAQNEWKGRASIFFWTESQRGKEKIVDGETVVGKEKPKTSFMLTHWRKLPEVMDKYMQLCDTTLKHLM